MFRTQFGPELTQVFGGPPPPPPPGYYPAPGAYGAPSNPNSGLAIGSLVSGILSLGSGLISLWFFALPLAIVGIILGVCGLRSPNRGMAIAGMIASGLGMIWPAVWILALLGFAALAPKQPITSPVPSPTPPPIVQPDRAPLQ